MHHSPVCSRCIAGLYRMKPVHRYAYCYSSISYTYKYKLLYPNEITIIYLENSKATHRPTCRSRCVTGRRVCFRCSYIAVCDLVTGRRVGLVCFRCSYIAVICKRVGKGRQFVLAVMTIEKILKFKHTIIYLKNVIFHCKELWTYFKTIIILFSLHM